MAKSNTELQAAFACGYYSGRSPFLKLRINYRRIMSMDFPDYLSIKEKNRMLAFAWIVGDRLYYIGMFGALFIALFAPISAGFSRLKEESPDLNVLNEGGLAAFVLCVLTFFAGGYLKAYARARAGLEDK